MKRIKIIIYIEMIIISIMCLSLRGTIIKYKPITLGMSGSSLVKEKPKPVIRKQTRQSNGSYKLTHYGADCGACSGITASGVDVRGSIYYSDNTYGTVHIIATNNDFPLYSIVEIKNYKFGKITAIVLDRGVGKGVIDLLVDSEAVASEYGIQNGVEINVLRYGK